MPKHGLARKLVFDMVECEGAKAVFSLKSTPSTLEKYPFEFELLATFELEGRALKNTLSVINKDHVFLNRRASRIQLRTRRYY